MRTKTRRRIVLLGLLAVMLGALAAYLVREHGRDAEARSAREEGLAAFDAGDYRRAVDRLRIFIGRLDPDALALVRYAQAIFRLPNPDADHIQSALEQLRRAIGLEPGNEEARRTLLEAARDHGLAADIRQQADWLLERDPRNDDALVAKAGVLAAQGQFEDALATLAPYIQISSPNLPAQLLFLKILAGLERSPDEIRQRAAEVRAAHAEDPAFALMEAEASLLVGDVPAARELLLQQVDVARGDRAFALLLVPRLDAAGMARDALRVMLGFEARDLDAGLRSELARRLWEAGRPSDVDEHIRGWKTPIDELPTPAVGYWAQALADSHRDDEASRLVATLRARSKDDGAQAWAYLLADVTLARNAKPAERIAAALRAIDRDPSNAVAHYELGRSYRAVGEVDLALRELATAARLARTWAEPLAVGARMLAQDGRLLPALQVARGAEARSSRDAGVAFLTAMISGASHPTSSDARARVLDTLERVQAPLRDTLAVRLALAASSRDADAARELVQAAVQMEQPPDAAELLACALLSRALGLGLENACEERYEAAYGVTPALALARARGVAKAEGASAGLARFRAQVPISPGDAGAAWAAAEATLLESQGQLDASLTAWRACASGASQDASLLRTLLSASAPWADRELVRKAIDDLKTITTERGLGWRFFRARFLLDQAAPTDAEVNEAAEYLRQILDANPDEIRARLMLAANLERRGDARGAIEQFRLARARLRSGAVIDLRIARLHIQLGDWDAARSVLAKLVAQVQQDPSSLAAPAQNALAALLSRLGERRQALALLDADSEAAFDPRAMQGRAELYAAAGELERAEQLIRPVLEGGESLRGLLLAAALAEFKGERSEAESHLESAAALAPSPLERERMRASHYLRVERLPEAETVLLRLVDMEGAAADDWRQLLACQLELGRNEALERTLSRAKLAETPASDNAPLGATLDPQLLRAAVAVPALRALASAYLLEPDNRAAALEALRLLAPLGAQTPSDESLEALVALADRYARCLSLQLVAADYLVRSAKLDRAIALCRRASSAFPLRPEPWRSMAYACRALRRHDEARAAAEEWRARTRGVPMECDVFLAQQEAPREAATRLEPYVAMAAERGNAELLLLFGEAEIAAGQVEALASRLRPHLERNTIVRAAWAELAALLARGGQASVAASWLREEAAHDGGRAQPSLRLRRAMAWQAVAEATGSLDDRATSRSLANGIGTNVRLDPQDWVLLGQVREANGDTDLAEQAYREALKASPVPLVAANNLALLLASSGRGLDALPLARSAVARRGDVPAYRDTLASVLLSLGDRESALSEYEVCVRLEPGNVQWSLRLVQTLLDLDRVEEARRRWRAVQAKHGGADLGAELREAWDALEVELGR